ncbi:hypothetical protein GJR88_05201 [Dietzia sp. DQ12-45-1b]|nr:hypothetical protein GJR88_05201 [Dietzia sp. DQ12-45-1b]
MVIVLPALVVEGDHLTSPSGRWTHRRHPYASMNSIRFARV